jgi:shikimate dehydrogenase
MNGPRITGTTRLYAIVGDPIAQVRSPQVFTECFAAAGIDAVMLPAHVPVDRFDTIIPGLMALGNLDGLLVTVPHKPRMLPFADRVGATAACIGAVNALRREADGTWTGDMFDGAGFVRGVESKGGRIPGRRVALFGAGGAGSAIACALADAQAGSIRLIDPDTGRVDRLVAALRKAFPACDIAGAPSVPADADMIVNASPVGMRAGDGLPGDIGKLTPDMLVCDVVILERPTPILELAQRHGCTWTTGRDMHAGQVDSVMAFFAAATAGAGGRN